MTTIDMGVSVITAQGAMKGKARFAGRGGS
jgi:hypothetical protein